MENQTNITLGFSRPKKWKLFAQIIMFTYGIPYDHVYIRYRSDKFDRDLIYQASSIMVNFMGEILFEEENVIVKEFKFQISDDERTEMIRYAIDNAGKPYGILSAIGLGIVRLAEIFGKKIKNPFGDGNKTYICCELGSYVLEQYAHINIPFDLDTISPKDLYEFLISADQLPKQIEQ